MIFEIPNAGCISNWNSREPWAWNILVEEEACQLRCKFLFGRADLVLCPTSILKWQNIPVEADQLLHFIGMLCWKNDPTMNKLRSLWSSVFFLAAISIQSKVSRQEKRIEYRAVDFKRVNLKENIQTIETTTKKLFRRNEISVKRIKFGCIYTYA